MAQFYLLAWSSARTTDLGSDTPFPIAYRHSPVEAYGTSEESVLFYGARAGHKHDNAMI